MRKVLVASRLVTLAGAGGIGKTRLALQAAAESSGLFPDGLWWVELASVSRGERVLGVLAQALGVREEEGAGLERTLLARLHLASMANQTGLARPGRHLLAENPAVRAGQRADPMRGVHTRQHG